MGGANSTQLDDPFEFLLMVRRASMDKGIDVANGRDEEIW